MPSKGEDQLHQSSLFLRITVHLNNKTGLNYAVGLAMSLLARAEVNGATPPIPMLVDT